MADLNQLELPDGSTYSFKDDSAVANITRSGTTFTATKRDGTTFTFTQQDNNTTYSLTQDGTDGHKITLTPSSGTAQTVTIPDNNTTYTFANGTNGFTVTPSGGSAQTVTVTPSITNNVTGSGTSGYLTKFNGTNTITNGPQLGSSTTTYLNNAGSWATPPDTKNTAGSTDTSSKIYLIGATEQSTNPQTYSDDQLYVTSGALQARTVSATNGINANTGNANNSGGVSLYSTTPSSYGVVMRGTGTATGQLGKHGYVQGDWAGYLCFDGATNRGWVFRHAGSNIASVSGLGNAVFNGSVTVGGNVANTSGCRLEYNSTTASCDFIFP